MIYQCKYCGTPYTTMDDRPTISEECFICARAERTYAQHHLDAAVKAARREGAERMFKIVCNTPTDMTDAETWTEWERENK